MKLRVRPKSDYLHKANFEELHKVTLEWESELKLWSDELQFFQRLIDKYILKMIEDSQIKHVQDIVDDIIYFNDIKVKEIRDKIKKHESHLNALMEDPFSHDETQFRIEHDQLEDEISAFMEKFKTFKQDIFSVIENVLKNEKVQHLLRR